MLQAPDNEEAFKANCHMHVTRMYIAIFPSVKLDCYFNNERDKAAFLVIDDADNFKRDSCVLPFGIFLNTIHKFKKYNFKHKYTIIYNYRIFIWGRGVLFIHVEC